MESLKPKHIAKHLPYRLEVEVLDYKKDYVGNQYDNVVGLHQWSKDSELWSVLTEGGAKPELRRVKPVLRPLSDLIEVINHEGEEFVPIDEIFKHVDESNYINYSGKYSLDNKEFGSDEDELFYVVFEENENGYQLQFSYGYGSFTLYSDTEEDLSISDSQSVLFECLYKWGFDVDGLIEEGLAVDRNTLKAQDND